MKKDKEAKKEKEDKKREKKEKKEKEKKDKHREQTTQEELNRLEEVKRGVFRRKSDRERKRGDAAERQSHDDDEGGFLQRDSDSSNSLASAGRLSPGREHVDAVDSRRIPPAVLPKPSKSILKSKSDVKAVSHDLDDSMVLQSNTAYNEVISGVPIGQEKQMKKSSQSLQASTKDIPPEFQPPPPPESPPPEKSFKATLKLPEIVPAKPPRVRELVINRTKAGDFGFTLRKGVINKKGNNGEDLKQNVTFAEPGAGQNSIQTGLIPGDRLIEVNGVNVETISRDEVIDLIRKTGDTVVLKVQPIPELVELSVRPSVDGSLVDVEQEVVKGGTLKRSGSMRYKKPVSLTDKHFCFLRRVVLYIFLILFYPIDFGLVQI